MQTVYVGSTIRITANFQNWSTAATPVLQDPTTITAQVLDQNNNVLDSPIPVRTGLGVYYFDWTPPGVGRFIASFLGIFPDNNQEEVTTVLEAVAVSAATTTQNNLEQDLYIEFYVNISPIYTDPYEISRMFPDAPLGEILELVYQYSQEANEITGIANLASADIPPEGMSWMVQAPYPSVTPFIREFVVANVACALTRIYDVGAGADELHLALADLQITRRNSIKTNVNRITATTWCELAGVLRAELYRTTKFSGMRSVRRGERVESDKIPEREIHHQEWRPWGAGHRWYRGNKFGGSGQYW